MKRVAGIILFSMLISGLSAQVFRFGTPVSKSYSMQVTRGAEQNWCITKDKFGAVYFGNDDNLVIRYDGTRWSTIKLNPDNYTSVRALTTDENGIVYVSGVNEFGYIQPDSSGQRVYYSMASRLADARDLTSSFTVVPEIDKLPGGIDRSIGELKSMITVGTKVYALSPGALVIYDSGTDNLSFVDLRELGFRQFERIFYIGGRIILTNNRHGLYQLEEGKISLLPGGDFFGFKITLILFPYSENKIIVATLNQGIYLYDYSTGSINSSFIEKRAAEKLKDLYIYSGAMLHSGEMAFGTTSDGVYLFDRNGINTGHWTSDNIEMQDNVITAMYADHEENSEIWISSTGTVSSVYVNLPFTRFDEKSGLRGSVNSFCRFNGAVFVATDQGLFRSGSDVNGNRTFSLFNDINSQIFPLHVAKFPTDSFLLAGSTFSGVYKIDSNNRSSMIPLISDPCRTVYQSRLNKNRFYFGLNSRVIRILDYRSGDWEIESTIWNIPGTVINIGELDNGDLIVLSNLTEGLFRIPAGDTVAIRYGPDKGIPESGLNYLRNEGGDFILSTNSGLLKLDKTKDVWNSFDDITGGYSKGKMIDGFYMSADNDLWISTNEERYYDILFSKKDNDIIMNKGGVLSVLPSLKYMFSAEIEGRYWMPKSTNIYILDETKLYEELPRVQTLLTRIVFSSHGYDSLVMNETFYKDGAHGMRYPVSSNEDQKQPEYRYNLNSPSFFWTTPYMVGEEEIIYSYKLDGFDDDWSNWSRISYKDYTNLPFGKYTFRVKARTATDIESDEAVYNFEILKPWYLSFLMILVYFIAAIAAVFGIIKAYTRRLKNENLRLEGIVAERTAVVVKQKEELESSIHYASRIQMALLPSESILADNIRNYFILFRPRDIVSGDFYWMMKKEERLYIVAADCTGHGVPGAFMSLLGMSFLDEIIDKESAPRADFILNQLRQHVTESLKQVGGEDEAKDGMDIALLVVDFDKQRVEFSGAYNPCFRVRRLSDSETKKYPEKYTETQDGAMTNGKYILETIYASKMPIGISARMNENFIFFDWKLEKGISYYLFSDGYIDQFGGPHGRKFMKKNFKRLLLDIQDYPMSRQKELLEKNLQEWMGTSPQIDDILVMGIRTE
ncbi:MAG TPA: triple tyrosine motif-containing protein [Bacteroidales bacterium]|nr:triple tyrosine motif-containing protein [Bacteroidales bacterium]